MDGQAKEIVEKLCRWPHRGVGSEYEKEILRYLGSLFPEGWCVNHAFRTHKTYLVTVYWIVGGIVFGIWLTILYKWIGVLVLGLFIIGGLRYFNWYGSFISGWSPSVISYNVFCKEPKEVEKRVLLMAHWDTAPTSLLYSPGMVGNFRLSLIVNQLLFLLVFLFGLLYSLGVSSAAFVALCFFSFYFIFQLIFASWGFWRNGYSNGASDNATGVAAAITTARQLWARGYDNIAVDVLITGAEEVGMIGAKAFCRDYVEELDKYNVINFDTLGNGTLRVIKRTGGLTNIDYHSSIMDVCLRVIREEERFHHIKSDVWHTADFDSVWFNRAGIPSITFAALDAQGKMPNIHTPSDTLENVDFFPMEEAIAFATEVADRLAYK